ncbi:hypothetical protein, partial [Candidatus Erwinia dacicola]
NSGISLPSPDLCNSAQCGNHTGVRQLELNRHENSLIYNTLPERLSVRGMGFGVKPFEGAMVYFPGNKK